MMSMKMLKASHSQKSAPASLAASHRWPAASRAFTIIELLVVTAIIIMLVSLLIVAMNAAARTSQKTRTAALMDTMKKGLIRFKEEVGYFPPVLGVPYTLAGPGGGPAPDDLRRLFPNSVPNPDPDKYTGGNYRDHMQEYYSTCTLADYLIGYGPRAQDGYGDASTESPWAGIRTPSYDGVWSAATTKPGVAGSGDGSLASRAPQVTGKMLGPYLELEDDRLLAAVMYVNGNLQTFFRGDTLPAGQTWDSLPKAIVDYWGMPIRYYRRPYPPGALGQSYRTGTSIVDPSTGQLTLLSVPTLSDIFVLRPWNIKPGSESCSPVRDRSPMAFADCAGVPDTGDPSTTRDLDVAEFALLSAGPDKRVNDNARRDDLKASTFPAFSNSYNLDNIVEIGP